MTELVTKRLVVKSSAFDHNNTIPDKYSCNGDNINPPLNVEAIPENTKSLAVVIDDPDSSDNYVHWVIWNIPPEGIIEEHSAPGSVGVNTKKENMYTGPCPPSGTHRYFFKVYALDTVLNLPESATREDLEAAMQGYVLASGELIGLYSHKQQ